MSYVYMCWSTQDELKFVMGLGSHRSLTATADAVAHRAMVFAYLEQMDRRNEWGDVDPVALREGVTRYLAELTV